MVKPEPTHRHWHYLRVRRRRKVHHTTRELLFGQVISVCGAVIAGFVLEVNKLELAALAGAFLILPGVFDVGGSIAGAMGARLNHRLQEGVIPAVALRSALLHAFFLLCAAGAVVSLVGATLGMVIFEADFFKLLITAYGAVLITAFAGLPIVAYGTFAAYKKGYDPDNFIGPIETSVFDTLTILSVAFMIGIIA